MELYYLTSCIWHVSTQHFNNIYLLCTLQDKYILVSMGILFAICVWHAVGHVVFSAIKTKAGGIADVIALCSIATFYIVFHIYFFIRVYFMVGPICIAIDQKDEWLQ